MTDTKLRSILRDLTAMERDRQLGYADSELHRDPREVLIEALNVLIDSKDEFDEFVLDVDQEALNLDCRTEPETGEFEIYSE